MKLAYPPELPVSARREDLLEVIGAHQVVVVAGETGSGKTTQLPKLCLELGRESIAHTQPRRLAARTVAERIAHELKVPLGAEVGYAVRFSDRSSAETRVRLMTDGLLLAEIQHDRRLRRYDTVIVDEAHERSLNIDFLLGYLKRLLPQRPELKLIITSATIDPERFAAHFDGAPVVEVSGRTYPVEVRHRPPADLDHEEIDAIADGVDELLREGPGDVLVFLSGEREIRDTADALRGRLRDDVEILPLFARLSSAEQQRVFKPHKRTRVVLATNVAETSLTVPGIRYVVDPGNARISRYSARLKVQRLPIEPISQASADQRKGRCGRTSDGICVRLYSESDYEARPRYTDPEILRTSLAAVILQMAALGLGDIEDFPFLDAPDRRQVRDGIRLLQELGALNAKGGLTKLGRRLAQLPIDPRLGRMVLEADRLGCADEVIVIAAALSIQDVRERPADKRPQADQQHARFADESSDFLAYLNLWRYLRGLQDELSSNQFRKRVQGEYLHHLRIREWQDLAGQIRQSARRAGVTINREPAEVREIHIALLSGLLSHLGLREARSREYLGARGARFALWPGSGIKPPTWLMVAELVETSRLWGRTAARIDPAWVEPLAKHLVKRSYSEPRWDAKRGAVVATERVTLYGLPIVAGRAVPYARIDPAASRELFIRRALVEGDWQTRHDFVEENRRRVAEVEALEERARRRDLLAGDEALVEFFRTRLPEDVVSGAHFDRWWRDARRADPELLVYPRELLLAGETADDGRPDTWRQGDLELPLSYVFEPGSERDGVTAHVPLKALGQVRDTGFDWLVPALREELVTALIRSLPKELRRPLVPVPEVVGQVLARLEPGDEPVTEALARELTALRPVRVSGGDFDVSRLPAHLRMRFAVEDERGATLAEGDDLDALRAQLRPRLQAELTAAARPLERHGLRDWPADLPELPKAIALPGTGGTVRAYPALVDEGDTAGVRVLDTPAQQRARMRLGTRRLLLATVPSPLRWVQGRLDSRAQLALAAAPHGSANAALEDAMTAALDALVDDGGGPAWDAEAFARLRDFVRERLADRTLEVVMQMVAVLDAERDVRRRMEGLTSEALQPIVRDVAAQMQRLARPGFATAVGAARLPDVERYVRAAARRLERAPQGIAGDLDRMRAIRELEDEYLARRERGPQTAALAEVPWLLEELRVSQFAQGLGTRTPVSAKRIRKLLA